MTHDSLEFYDMYRDRLRDMGIEAYSFKQYRTVHRYRKKPRTLLAVVYRVLGAFLLYCGRKLVYTGERLKGKDWKCCSVHGLADEISLRGAG